MKHFDIKRFPDQPEGKHFERKSLYYQKSGGKKSRARRELNKKSGELGKKSGELAQLFSRTSVRKLVEDHQPPGPLFDSKNDMDDE